MLFRSADWLVVRACSIGRIVKCVGVVMCGYGRSEEGTSDDC